MSIPKIIIQTLVGEEVPEKYVKYSATFAEKNPDYEIKHFSNEKQEAFIKEHYAEYYDDFMRLPMLIQRSDFFRLAAVHYYGGIYFDIDIECDLSLDALLNNTLVFPVEEHVSWEIYDYEKSCGRYMLFDATKDTPHFTRYGQYSFAAKKNHPFIKQMMDDIVGEIDLIASLYKQHQELGEDKGYELYIYNSTATDRATRSIYTWKPEDLTTLDFTGNVVRDDRGYLYPLKVGDFATHWCDGVWKPQFNDRTAELWGKVGADSQKWK